MPNNRRTSDSGRQENKNIVRYRRRANIPISTILFLLIFIYLVIMCVIYLTRDHVTMYEVTTGQVEAVESYTGLILRNETLVSTDTTGYLNYYVREGHKAKVGATVCSIDETGSFTAQLEEAMSESGGLSEDQLASVKSQLYQYASAFEESSFSELYQVKYDLDLELIEDAYEVVQNSVNDEIDSSGFVKMTTDVSGAISYHLDGFEGYSESQLTADTIDPAGYRSTMHRAGDLVEEGTTVYKVIPDDNWRLVFLVDQDFAEQYQAVDTDGDGVEEQKYLTITVDQNGVKLKAPVTIFAGADGSLFAELTFTKYGTEYVTDRYLSFTTEQTGDEGLKIPESALVQEEFFVVPASCITYSGDSNDRGVLLVKADSDTPVFTKPVFYGTQTDDDGNITGYYLSEREFSEGQQLAISVDSDDAETAPVTEYYTIGETATLDGVFQVNQGYALFRRVDIIDEDGDMYIIRKGLSGSVSKYDHIVLNSSKVEEYQVIY